MNRPQTQITERPNTASADLDTKPTRDILRIINREDRKVAAAVSRTIPQISQAVDLAVAALTRGGRLVYLGAGTSGRLGVLDAAECIPTFGTNQVVAILAGAPGSMFRPSEMSEDDHRLGVSDLRTIGFGRNDVLVGVSASGRTPYVLGGLRYTYISAKLDWSSATWEARRIATMASANPALPQTSRTTLGHRGSARFKRCLC